jgi:hypothetical protein
MNGPFVPSRTVRSEKVGLAAISTVSIPSAGRRSTSVSRRDRPLSDRSRCASVFLVRPGQPA